MSDESAIVTDVQQVVDEESVKIDTAHDDAVEAIALEREKQSAQGKPWEQQAVTERHDDSVGVETDGAVQQQADVPVVEFTTADGQTIKVPVGARYRAKVDGEEIDVDVDALSRSYQKGASADKRLAEAATQRKALEDYERSLAARLQAAKEAEERAKAGPSPTKRADRKAQAQALYDALLSGEDDPVESIAKVLEEIGPDTEEVIRRAEAQAATRAAEMIQRQERGRAEAMAEQKRNEANQWFSDTYQEIVADKHLLELAMKMGRDRLAENPSGDYREMVKGIGDEITGWINGKAGGSMASAESHQREKPRAIPAPRNGHIPKKMTQTVTTRADILAEMKRDRMQPA